MLPLAPQQNGALRMFRPCVCVWHSINDNWWLDPARVVADLCLHCQVRKLKDAGKASKPAGKQGQPTKKVKREAQDDEDRPKKKKVTQPENHLPSGNYSAMLSAQLSLLKNVLTCINMRWPIH